MAISGENIGYSRYLDQVAEKLRRSENGVEVFGFRERELQALMGGVVAVSSLRRKHKKII